MSDDTTQFPGSKVDAAIADYLEAMERGTPPDREAFLAQHADAGTELRQFLTDYHALKYAVATPRPRPSTTAGRGSTDRSLAQKPVSFSARDGLSSQWEIQSLLRKRLRFIALFISAVMVVGFSAWRLQLNGPVSVFLYSTLAVVSCAATVRLWRRRPISLGLLRWIEASLFAVAVFYFSWQDLLFFQSGWFNTLASYHEAGVITAARSQNAQWVLLIILYGILIPNTAWRCLLAVVGMALLRMTVLAVSVLSAPQIAVSEAIEFLLISVIAVMFGGAVAIFGAHRIESLRRTASQARKLGPYQLTRRLGSGGMGEVYLAQHALLRRPCAVKLIRPDQVGDANALARFEREVQSMATLTHPNTVRIYDYGLAADGTFYYAMEYLPGMSLQELVTLHGPLPPARAVHLLRQVCEALREAHSVGLVHRDIKPANILACQIGGMYDVTKLLDFGLVRVHNPVGDGAQLTRVGTIAGTPAFMSPEQASGTAHVDKSSDIYSLGAVAYFLLIGRPPFVHRTPVEIMAAHLTEPVVVPPLLRAGMPGDLEAVILRCLVKEPKGRFLDVAAVEQALANCACRDDWSPMQAANWWHADNR